MLRFIRKFGTFKRPPPSYMFKRPVVPSDLQIPPKKHIFDIENEKWCNDNDNDDKDNKLEKPYSRINKSHNKQD